MQRIYHFGIVTIQLQCNEGYIIKSRRFTDTKLHQRDCCEELCVKFNVVQLCVDVKFKQTASHFDDIKYARNRVTDLEGKLQNKNGKTTRQSNTAHIL